MQEKLYIAKHLGLTPDTSKTYQISEQFIFAHNIEEARRKALTGRGRNGAKALMVFECVEKIDLVEYRAEKKRLRR